MRPPPGGSGGREAARVLTALPPPEGLVGLRWAFSSSRRMPSTRVSRWEAAKQWEMASPCQVRGVLIAVPAVAGSPAAADRGGRVVTHAAWRLVAGMASNALHVWSMQELANGASHCEQRASRAGLVVICPQTPPQQHTHTPLGQRLGSTMRAMASACRSRVSRSCVAVWG